MREETAAFLQQYVERIKAAQDAIAPDAERCPACGGTGRWLWRLFRCHGCNGFGFVSPMRAIKLRKCLAEHSAIGAAKRKRRDATAERME